MKNLSHVSLGYRAGIGVGKRFSLYLLQVGLGKVREGALVWDISDFTLL